MNESSPINSNQNPSFCTNIMTSSSNSALASLSSSSTTTTTTATTTTLASSSSSTVNFIAGSNGSTNEYQQHFVSFTQPIMNWTTESVAQWLQINDLAFLIETFLEKMIDGEKLLSLDNSKLKVIYI